ncbi:MAG TPA: tetratricopeptide repeat protein, partial [Verrucomicrobiae bacterium]|nr:tetratricopeptide repeat protein [Verrucomicrobiae bacterium]
MPKNPEKSSADGNWRAGLLLLVVAVLLAGGVAALFILPRSGRAPTLPAPANPVQTAAASNSILENPAAEAILKSTNAFEEASSDIDKATEHMKKGNDLLAAGNVTQAIEEFRTARKFNPEDEDIHYNLGLALAQNGNLAEAKEAYNEALKIYPDYVEAQNNLGNLLVKEGNLDEAIEHLKKAVELDPKS